MWRTGSENRFLSLFHQKRNGSNRPHNASRSDFDMPEKMPLDRIAFLGQQAGLHYDRCDSNRRRVR